eukprot:g1049.t1
MSVSRLCFALRGLTGVTGTRLISSQVQSTSNEAPSASDQLLPIHAASVVARAPLIKPLPEDWELEYQSWAEGIRSRKQQEVPKSWRREKRSVIDEEDGDQSALQWQPNPRTTQADKTGDVKSLMRLLDRYLYFVVKSRTGIWSFPSTLNNEGETIRQTGERALTECVVASDVFFIANWPIAHHKVENEGVDSRLEFYMKAQILSGKLELKPDSGYTDYVWISKSEMGDYFTDNKLEELMRKALRERGQCIRRWMRRGGYCALTCGFCQCYTEDEDTSCDSCDNIAPDEQFTCEQQWRLGKCDESWMRPFCRWTCGRCSCNDDRFQQSDSGLYTASFEAFRKPRKSESLESTIKEVRLNDDGVCPTSLYEALADAQDFTLLVEILKAAGMSTMLQDKNLSITVFAPVNKAFEELVEEFGMTLDVFVREYPEKVKELLQYHVVPRAITDSKEFGETYSFDTLVPEKFLYGSSSVEIDGIGSSAAVIQDGVKICKSMVYAIDKVLLPGNSLDEIGPIKEELPVPKDETLECNPDSDIMANLNKETDLTLFVKALKEAKVNTMLQKGKKTYTVFAPTNEAFERTLLEAGLSFDDLVRDRQVIVLKQLQAILKYHILDKDLDSEKMSTGDYKTTGGDSIVIAVENSGIELAGIGSSATVIEADIDDICTASIHKVDSLLLPFEVLGEVWAVDGIEEKAIREEEKKCNSIAQVLSQNSNLRVLNTAVQAAGLKPAFVDKDQAITIFAPTDTAFYSAFVDPETKELAAMLTDPESLRPILSYHVVSKPLPFSRLRPGTELETRLENKKNKEQNLKIVKKRLSPTGKIIRGVNGDAAIIQKNIVACNSVIHLIDNVLLPYELSNRVMSVKPIRFVRLSAHKTHPRWNRSRLYIHFRFIRPRIHKLSVRADGSISKKPPEPNKNTLNPNTTPMKKHAPLFTMKPSRWLFRSAAAVLLGGQVFFRIATGKIHLKNTLEQLEIVGPRTLGVALLTSGFVGMVFTIQFVREFAKLGLTRSVGGVLALALARELSPVVTSIILAGRVGSAFAAELGTMVVSEQTDSMRVLDTDPVDYLITPRVLASMLACPILNVLCFCMGMGAAVLLADVVYNVAANVILDSALRALTSWDIVSSMIKAWVFGAIISVVSCAWGYTTSGGAKGVGTSTTRQTDSGGFLADEIPLEISTSIPSGILNERVIPVSGQQALTVVFSRPVIALGSDFGFEQLPSELVPFTLDPAVPGRGRWVTTFIYRFDTEGPFATNLNIVFQWNTNLTTYDGVPLTLESSDTVILRTPELTMSIETVSSELADAATDDEWGAFVGTSRDILPEVPPDGIIRLSFNAPVSLAVLQESLRVRNSAGNVLTNITPMVTACRPAREVTSDESRCANVTLDGDLEMGVEYFLFMEAGVDYGSASGPLSREVSARFGGLRDFYIPFNDQRIIRVSTPFLNLYLPHGLAEGTDLADIPISITDSNGEVILFNLTQITRSVLLINAPLMPSMNYVVSVQASSEIRDGFGIPLNSSEANLQTGNLFGQFRGLVPPDFPAYGVFEANEDWGRLAVSFAKGTEENDNGLCDAGSVLDIWSVEEPESVISLFTGSSRPSFDRFLGPPSASLVSERQDPIATLATFELDSLLDQSGVIATQYCRFNNFNPAVFLETSLQAVVISSRATRTNDLEVSIWVTSMVTGEPIEGANVVLLQYTRRTSGNPRTLGQGTTDENGIARVPATNTQDNIIAIVRVGAQVLYIPNVFIRRATMTAYSDSIVLDRALVRPGETLYVKGYIMEREGTSYTPATRLSNTRLSVSPAINDTRFFPVELDEEFGSYQALIEVPEDADLRQYNIRFVSDRPDSNRDFNGESASFTVGDPRLPTIELTTDTPVFVRPDEQIEMSVQVTSFIGSAVGGQNITVEWRIFDSRRDDGDEEDLEGELVITTDDNGSGSGIIDFTQFENPPSLGTTATLDFQLVGPTSELIEESASVRIEAADLSVSLERTVDTNIPGQQFGAALTVTDLQGAPLSDDKQVDSATISLIRAPEDTEDSSIPTSSTESFDGEVVASCEYEVGSEEYCDFAIPEIGLFVLEGCLRQGDIQLCRRTTLGRDAESWEQFPLRQSIPVGFADLNPEALRVGETKEILIENPYYGAYLLISWGTVDIYEEVVQTLDQGRQTVGITVPEFCEFDCGLSLVLAIPRQTKGLAANITVPVSLLFDAAMPHTVTYRDRIDVIASRQINIDVNISLPDARVDDDSAVIAPGENTTIEVQLDREGRTEVTLIAVDRAVLDLVPYSLQNTTLDFLIDLATSFDFTTIDDYLVAPGAIQVLIDNFFARRQVDPWFSLVSDLGDSFSVDRSLEEYIEDRSRFITVRFFDDLRFSRRRAFSGRSGGFGSGGGGGGGGGGAVAFALASTTVSADSSIAVARSVASPGSPGGVEEDSITSEQSVEQSLRLESEFESTPLFITEVAENGILRANFTAPPNLGTFIIRAYAASGSGLFGSAETEVIVRREVSLTPSVPRFARVGDVFEAGAVVTASGSTIVPISLTASAEGPLEFIGESSLTVEVGGDGQEEARFLVRATAVGMANFTLFADDSQGNTDALQLEIPIEGLQEAVTVGTSFVIQGDDAGAFTEGLALPAAVPGSGDIEVTAGVGRQPAVFAIANQVLNRNPNFTCPVYADVVVASAALAGIVDPYSPWNPDPEVVSSALVEEINRIIPRFDAAVELLAVDSFFEQENPSIAQNQRGVFLINQVEQNFRNHELEEVRLTAEALFQARNVWRGVLASSLENRAIEARRRDGVISFNTVASALAALGPNWTPETTNATIIDDLSLDRLSRNFSDLSIESQGYYILTRLAQEDGSSHPDIPMAFESWTNLLRITGRTAYISAFPGATAPASNLANALVFLAFTRGGEEGQLIPRLGSYIAAPVSDNYGFAFFGTYEQAITMQALVEFDVSRGSAQPNLTFEARTGSLMILEAMFSNTTAPVASASVLWDDLPPNPAPIEVSAVGEGEAFVAITLNFIPAEILPFPSYRGIYVERSIQLEDAEDGDGPGLRVVPRGSVVTVKIQFLTPDALDETVIRSLMPAGLEPVDPNISPGSSPRFCPIPFFSIFSFFYRRCPVQETRPTVVTITYDSVRPGTSSVTFRAVAATVGNYTLPPTRVFVTDQPEVMGLSSGGRFEVCAGPNCQPEFLESSPVPVSCIDDCNNSGSCNLSDGSCLCFSGFTGPTCETIIEI